MDRKKQWGTRRRGGGDRREREGVVKGEKKWRCGGGCSEGCWQHRLLSRCYIEWVDEYLRRSTSCGFFFNQANLLVPSSSAVTRLSHPPSLVFTCSNYGAKRVKLFMPTEREREREREFQEFRHPTHSLILRQWFFLFVRCIIKTFLYDVTRLELETVLSGSIFLFENQISPLIWKW